jgi:two-component system CheB/CheR fusion protein
MVDRGNGQELSALLDYLKRNRGFDFSGYKTASLRRRIQKRMNMVNISSFIDFIDYLEVHPEEFTQLFNTILINVTGFFRDPAAWDYLRDEILPRLVAAKKTGGTLRVWSTGCASGEEAYSIAILLVEALGEDRYQERVKIYATDVDEDALTKARLGTYSEKEVDGIPEDLLERYFTLAGASYSFRKDLRRNLIFGRNDLIQDAPISRIDLLICRNTLMYFNAETQAKIIARFHFSLSDTGYLFLGKAEMLLTHTNTFTPVDLKLRIFSKVPKVNLRDRLLIMAHSGNEEGVNHLFSLVRIRDSAFDAGPLAQLVIDANNSLLLANEQARQMFGIQPKDLGRPFQDLEVSYRPLELRSAIQRVSTERVMILIKDVEWASTSGERLHYDVRIQPLFDNGKKEILLGVSATFSDVTLHKQLEKQLEQTNHELETAFEELQSTNEELETTNEELQSTIEELETTNEELQSTNEELETMNEELQSTNEELQTMNDELRLRTEELNQVNSFMESILTSVRWGVVVLDRELRIQVWNRRSEDLWGLRADEVLGKSFLNLDIGLPVVKLKRPMLDSLSGESNSHEIVLEARNRRGKKIRCRVSTTPLLTNGKEIHGIIGMMEEEEIEEPG